VSDPQISPDGRFIVCLVLRLNPRTVREYVQRGELQGRIIGGRWRFRRADLDAFYEEVPRGWDFREKGSDGD